MTFGQLLKYYRQGKGVSQEKLALAAGFCPSFISRLESGGRGATRNSVLKIGAALDLTQVEIDRLLMTADLRPVRIASALFEPKLADLDDVLYAASTQVRAELMTMIDMALRLGRVAIQEDRRVA